LSSRPKLLILASTFPRWRDDHEPGFVFELAKRLVATFEITVLAPSATGAVSMEVTDGVRVIRYRYAPARLETLVHQGGIVANLKARPWKWLLLPTFFAAQIWSLMRLCRVWQPDVIHAHWIIPQGLSLHIVARLMRRCPPHLITSHGGDLYGLSSRPFRWLKSQVVSRASAVSVVSTAMVEPVATLGLATQKVLVLPMGVDLSDRFVPLDGAIRSRTEILFVGRLVRKKGLDVLIAALPEIRKQVPDVRLTIVGFGPEESALRNLAERSGVSGLITFIGPVKQAHLPPYYQRAAVFVAPFLTDAGGDQEGLPVALMEAIGCLCPVIVGDVAGIGDLLGSDRTARVVPGDAAALARAVISVLNEPEASNASAVARRLGIVRKVDWHTVASGYRKALLEAMGEVE
jgi:glycosyltransferase involved in cell wall biosynthesis